MAGLDGAKILFIQELKTQITEIQHSLDLGAITVESAKNARTILHRIKGAAGFFGFTALSNCTDTLLKRCKKLEEDPGLIKDQTFLSGIKTDLAPFASEIQSLIDV